jgi:phage anti-repressor protein
MSLWDKKTQSKILKMSLSQVEQKNEQLLKNNDEVVEGRDVITVMSFENGLKWKKLLTAASYQCHGRSASNCLDPQLYISIKQYNPEAHEKNTVDGIYGLYKGTKAKATLAVGKGNRINEVAFFGKEYRPFILELMKKYKLVPDIYWSLCDEGLCKWPPYEEYLDSVGYDRGAEETNE